MVPLDKFPQQRKGSLRKRPSLAWTFFRNLSRLSSRNAVRSVGSREGFPHFESCQLHVRLLHLASNEDLTSREPPPPLRQALHGSAAHRLDCETVSNFWRPPCRCCPHVHPDCLFPDLTFIIAATREDLSLRPSQHNRLFFFCGPAPSCRRFTDNGLQHTFITMLKLPHLLEAAAQFTLSVPDVLRIFMTEHVPPSL